MRRFELHPIDPGGRAIGLEARQRVVEPAIRGIPRVALRHHDEIRVELVFHVDRGAVARERLLERHHLDPGI
ncbi:MAG TPA: hypothetical protein VJ251_02000, partial [Stellaceae bacterium]|nr:hypothetical protein [Stellaceae bacterium]